MPLAGLLAQKCPPGALVRKLPRVIHGIGPAGTKRILVEAATCPGFPNGLTLLPWIGIAPYRRLLRPAHPPPGLAGRELGICSKRATDTPRRPCP